MKYLREELDEDFALKIEKISCKKIDSVFVGGGGVLWAVVNGDDIPVGIPVGMCDVVLKKKVVNYEIFT